MAGIKESVSGVLNKPIMKEGGEVNRKEMLRYGLGIAGQNISCGLTSWILFYSNIVLGVSIGVIGTIITITRIWDAVNDPLMGSLIDRHRFSNGEKLRPFLRYAALVAGVANAMLFIMAFLLNDIPWLFAIVIFITYFIYDVSFTVQDLSMWGMTSVMTPHSAERSKVAQLGRIFAMIGAWLPGLIQPMMSLSDKIGLQWKHLFLILALLLGFGGMMISTLSHSAKERIRTPKPDKDEVSLKDSLNLLFKNKIVMLIMLGSILSGLSMGVGAIYFFIFKVGVNFTLLNGSISVSATTMAFVFELVAGIPGVFAMLFAGKIKKLLRSWRNVLVCACILPILVRILCYFIGWEGDRILIVMALLAFGNFLTGLNGIAVTSLLGDSLDYMEWKTGMRGEGITFAAQIFSNKIGYAINTGVFTLIMFILHFDTTNFEDYKDGKITELAGAANFAGVAWELFMLGPIVGLMLQVIPLLFIKYSEHQREEIESQLSIRRAAAEGLSQTVLTGELSAEAETPF